MGVLPIYHRLCVLLSCFLLIGCTNGLQDNVDGKADVRMEEEFFIAAKTGDLEELEEVLDKGAPIDMQDDQGNTAVMLATMAGHVDVVQWFIDEGANLNVQNDRSDNVLLYAGAEGLLDIVTLAVEAGADTTLTNRYGGTALIPAADRGHVDIVDYLLTESDVDVNHVNNLHWTALLEAVILGDGGENHQKIVGLLLENGADSTLEDRDGVTPLEHAKRSGFLEMVELLEAGR